MQLFKKDLQLPVEAIIEEKVPQLIEAAVLKGQIELTEMFFIQTGKEADASDTPQEDYETFIMFMLMFGRVSAALKKQLEYITTTEEGEDSENCKSKTKS